MQLTQTNDIIVQYLGFQHQGDKMQTYNFKTYSELFNSILKNHTNHTFLNYIDNNVYKNISVEEFGQKTTYLAYALKDLGIQKNESVAIYASSSPFWLIFDFALHIIGAVSVPIFANISLKNLKYEINDSQVKYIFIDSPENIDELKNNLTIITAMDKMELDNYITLTSLYKHGKKLYENQKYDLNELINAVDEDDLFSVIYTSGNTGLPKGVELTHKNIISQLHNINADFHINDKDRALSLLPLAHIFERAVMSFYLSRGVSVYFVDELPNVANLMKEVKPTMMTVVPRLLEKIFNKMKTRISEKKGISYLIATAAFNRALKKREHEFGLLDSIYDKLVYSRLRESFGGELEILVTGGASLDKEIYRFFVNIGMNLYQGYGLTEFSPVICSNNPAHHKVETSGLPFKDVEVKLTQDGELLARGKSVMRGYRNQPELTREVIDEQGWLHTGDLASIDKQGYITIKSRKKELFKTSTGEYVSAIPIEQAISKSNFVDFTTVIANGKKYATSLIFIDHEIYEKYKQQHHLNEDFTVDDYYNMKTIQKKIKTHIKKVNKNLNAWEQIIKYEIVTTPISIETGELTPSMKVCRAVIEEKYKNIINSMYEE